MIFRCAHCETTLINATRKYCSNKCQLNAQYESYINLWKQGKVSGFRGVRTGNMSAHVKRYLFNKYNGICSICRWSRVNESSGKIPLEIDHIDGNAQNNSEQNLRLLCPNCHALTPTFRGLNAGNGRKWRREKYVKS